MSQRIVTCPSCGAKYRIPETFKGSKAACKKCGTVIEIPPPGREQAEPAPVPPAGEETPKAPAPEEKAEKAEKKERPSRGRARAGGRTRTGTRGSRRARAAAEGGGEEAAGEEGGERPSRGRRSGRAGRARAGGRGGSRRGGRRRAGGEEEERGGNNAMVIGLVAALVVVAAVVAYFLLSGGEEKKPAPTQTAKAKPEKPKVDAAEAQRQKLLAEEKARQAKKAAAKPEKTAPKPAPKKTEKTAKKPSGQAAPQQQKKKKKRIPPPEVDLEHLEPLDFPAGTPDKLKEEIKSLTQDAFDVWGGARQNRAINKLIQIGYPAIPIVINKIIKLDYMKKEDVELGQVLFRLLTDMCNGQGVEFKGEFDEVEKKDPWDCEYDIRWNRSAAYTWYKYWKRFGDTRENWEKHIAFKKKKK